MARRLITPKISDDTLGVLLDFRDAEGEAAKQKVLKRSNIDLIDLVTRGWLMRNGPDFRMSEAATLAVNHLEQITRTAKGWKERT